MNVRYEHKEALTFIGYHTEIRPEEGYEKCPRFWDREYTQKYARLWQTMTPENEAERANARESLPLMLILWTAGLLFVLSSFLVGRHPEHFSPRVRKWFFRDL